PGEARSDPWESRRCYMAATAIPKRGKKETLILDPREPCKPDTRPEPTELILEVPLKKERLERMVRVGSALPEDQHIWLIDFLGCNANVFAWSPSDMPSVHLKIAHH
ncbi:hypothetical protein GW17_00061925, partial [Ensete ventricosum]